MWASGIFMLGWLLASPFLVAAGVAATAPKSNIMAVLSNDIFPNIFSKLGIAALCQAMCVSKDFCRLANQVIKSLYGIENGGKAYWNYTKLLRERDMLVQNANEMESMAETHLILKGSSDYQCIQLILEAAFGHCTKCVKGGLPEFCLREVLLDILDDPWRSSALPYFLDEAIEYSSWVDYIRVLARRGRFDLLEHMTFSRMTRQCFYELVSAVVPKSVLMTAMEALRKNEPTVELVSLLAYAWFGAPVATLPENLQVPLFVFQHLHEKGIAIPERHVLVGGLDESSLPFWMHMLTKGGSEVETLLKLVLKHGDDNSKRLAGVFYGPVPDTAMYDSERDVYQAMLVRFHFSPICNSHVVLNYDTMVRGLTEVDFHSMHALVDCNQHYLVYQCAIGYSSEVDLGPLTDKMAQFRGHNVNWLIGKCVGRSYGAPGLLRRLIRRRAADAHVQLVWDSIQRTPRFRTVDDHSCSAPLGTLKTLLLEQDISIEDAQRMLGALCGFQGYGADISKELHILYTVIFWEAPERVIDHFLGQVPGECKLNCRVVVRLLMMAKYSSELCRKLIRCCGQMEPDMEAKLKLFRPDLVTERSLQD